MPWSEDEAAVWYIPRIGYREAARALKTDERRLRRKFPNMTEGHFSPGEVIRGEETKPRAPRRKPDQTPATVLERYHRCEYCGEFFRAGEGERWCANCAPIKQARRGGHGKEEGS